MQKINYQKELDKILESINTSIKNGKNKPSLLLHACCAPCSSYVIEYLQKFFDITIFYYNPNIYPVTEYERRLNELINFVNKFIPQVKIIQTDYNQDDFNNALAKFTQEDLINQKEGQSRCYECYKFRMQKAYSYAVENKFDYFTTTLSISPFKNAHFINLIGKELENNFVSFDRNTQDQRHTSDNGQNCELEQSQTHKTLFLTSDFKKKNGFKRSLELSTEYNLYRQQYCGCVYSFNNRNSQI